MRWSRATPEPYGMFVDPRQTPTDLKVPAMEAGQPNVTAPHDTPALLAAIAGALNDAERAGLLINGLEHGTVQTRAGCVVPFGTAELGHRWVARPRIPRTQGGGKVA